MKELFAVDIKSIFRGLFLSILGTTFVICLFFIAYGLVFNQVTANREKVKGILGHSSLYDKLFPSLYDSVAQSSGNNQSEIPLNDSRVRQIALSVFTPSFTKNNIEKLLDGTYDWLEGKSEIPSFTIDLKSQKSLLANKLGEYAREKAARLPACSYKQLQKIRSGGDLNVLRASCLPHDVSISQAGRDMSSSIKNSKDFLSDTSITASDIKGKNGQPFYESMKELPQAYSNAKLLPLVLGVIALIFAIIIMYASASKAVGFKRLSRNIGIAGIFISLTPVIFQLIGKTLVDRAGKDGTQESMISMIQSLFDGFMAEAAKIYYTFGLALLLLAVGLYIYARKIQNQHKGGEIKFKKK